MPRGTCDPPPRDGRVAQAPAKLRDLKRPWMMLELRDRVAWSRGYVHLMQDSQPPSPRETHQVHRPSCGRFQGFVTILVALLLLGIGRIPHGRHLRGSQGAAQWRRWVESAYLQGQVAGELPKNWTTKSVDGVPVFQNSTQAPTRAWLVKVWTHEELSWQQHVNPKDDYHRLESVLHVARNLSLEVLFHGHRGGLPMLAARASSQQLQALLNRTKDLVQFVEEDTALQATGKSRGAAEETNVDFTSPGSRHRASLQDGPPSWGLDRIDQRGPVVSGDNSSYRYRPKAGETVHVYVLDTGIRTSHKDFGGRAVRELEVTEKGLHMCEDNDDEDCAMDFQGHGTSIAGILGGHRYGVAKSATIHALKVLDDHGRGHSWQMMAAFDWLLVHAEQPAIAVLGSATQGQLSAWRAAADAASRAGITVVAAAGDEGDTAHPDACEYTPGYIPSVLTVGATTRHDTRANTSNFGQCINLMAPGEDLTSAGIGSDTAELRRSAGSALAAAHVAGAAALVLSEKPHLQSHEVIQRLIDSSTVGRLSHLHAAPDRLVNSLGEEVSVPSWAEEGMWSLVDGGKDRACGGLDGEEGEDFVAFREVHDLESCKVRCEHSESTTGCAGISYSREEEICQIHVDLVRSSKQMTGYICLRHEAPTTTRSSMTTSSLTSSTRSRTSMTYTSRTSTSMTTTTMTQSTRTVTSLRGSWKQAEDLNCYWGAGAATAEGKDFVGLLPLEECLKECSKVDSCEASLYQDFGRVGNCWLRSKVDLPKCVKVPGYSLWFSPSKLK
ncbi:unnamed protein product [Durusdinium trenchii]|uniref:subtilisin n=1 Tax=Durusdinium trenchii TaxID=1381693 RepID=A0ABP0JCK7_9DINO